MTRDEMIDLLLPELVQSGSTMASARRRLWGMSRRALERELLLRGLTEYDDSAQYDEDQESEDSVPLPSALGWACAPVYLE
jgi:hypothetical protein